MLEIDLRAERDITELREKESDKRNVPEFAL